jgi:hypothetical protein
MLVVLSSAVLCSVSAEVDEHNDAFVQYDMLHVTNDPRKELCIL